MARAKKTEDTGPRCPACRWFRRFEDADRVLGMCRRYPPQVVTDDDGDPVTVWPLVDDAHHCGEFTGGQA